MQIVISDRDAMYHLLSRWCLGKYLQDVAIWYNHQNGYRRTFSMDRFQGRVAEPLPWAMAFVAAYFKVHLPRSGQAADPADCRYCSYTATMGRQASDLAEYPFSMGDALFPKRLLHIALLFL